MGSALELVFVGGTGRSGTSVTRELLGKVAEIGVLRFEHRILIDPDGPIDFLDRFRTYQDPFKVDLAIRRLFSHLYSIDRNNPALAVADWLIRHAELLRRCVTVSKYSGWQLSKTFPNYRSALSRFEQALSGSRYKAAWVGSAGYQLNNEMRYLPADFRGEFISALRSFYLEIITEYLTDTGKKMFVEDSTWNMNNAESLCEIFPNAFFIHVFRDPRDVVASLITQRWMPSDIQIVVRIYKDLIWRIQEEVSKIERHYALKLEAMVQNQAKETQKLCEFLGVSHNAEVANFPLSGASIGRFKRDFNKETIEFLNAELAAEMSALGYET